MNNEQSQEEQQPPQRFSSLEMSKAWLYGGIDITPDLTTPGTVDPDGSFCFATKALSLALPHANGPMSLNADNKLLAIAAGNDIHIYDTTNFSLKRVLKGHLSEVAQVAFHPKTALTLLSASEGRADDEAEPPIIMLWQLDERVPDVAESGAFLHHLGSRAVDVVVQALKDAQSVFTLSQEEQGRLTTDFARFIEAINVKQQAALNTQILGRVHTQFGSSIWNHDGSRFVYRPGLGQFNYDSLKQGDDSAWDICVWDVERERNALVLRGHTDEIMWMGFSPDEKFIASACWDQTFRIWNSEDGSCVYNFKTQQQNWTAAFSANSRYFAGTSGDGYLWIYDLTTGENVASYEFGAGDGGEKWARSLKWQPAADGERYTLALGIQCGRLELLSFDGKALALVRSLAFRTDKNPQQLRQIMRHFLETTDVTFFSNTKLAWACPSDRGVQLYDIEENRLWRFEPESYDSTDPLNPSVPLLLGSRGLIVVSTGDELRLFQAPGAKTAVENMVTGLDWTKENGTWRKPADDAAYEILFKY